MQDIFYLPDMNNMQVKLTVHESVINRIKVDQRASIRLDAFSDFKLGGKVSYVSELVASSYGDAKNYDATVVVDQIPEGLQLKPGMTAEVEILVGTYENILAIPVGAVTEHFQQTYVYVQEGDSFRRQPVKTGRSSHSFVEIVEGLKPDMVVAMDAYQRGTNDFAAAERKSDDAMPPKKMEPDAAGAAE
jgi:multidrug efflux pump subunit AcrA (membrane-fusion protein)